MKKWRTPGKVRKIKSWKPKASSPHHWPQAISGTQRIPTYPKKIQKNPKIQKNTHKPYFINLNEAIDSPALAEQEEAIIIVTAFVWCKLGGEGGIKLFFLNLKLPSTSLNLKLSGPNLNLELPSTSLNLKLSGPNLNLKLPGPNWNLKLSGPHLNLKLSGPNLNLKLSVF